MITDKEYVNEVRRKLQSYTTFKKQIKEWEGKIEHLEDIVNGVPTGSPKPLPDSTAEYDQHWRTPFYDQINRYKRIIYINQIMIILISEFVLKLESNDQKIISLLYLSDKKLSEQEVASACGYTRSGIQKRVAKLIMDYWEY